MTTKKNYQQKQVLPSALVSVPPDRITWGAHFVSPRFDKLVVGFFIDFKLSMVLERLQSAKEHAQEVGRDVSFDFGGHSFIVAPAGTRRAQYVMKAGDVTILISTRKKVDDTPNLTIEIGSVSSYGGYNTAIDNLRHSLDREGCKIYRMNKISRADLCVDSLGDYIGDLPITTYNNWIKRARKQSEHYSTHSTGVKLSGVSIGSGDVLFRMYDKVLELQRNPSKQLFFAQQWGFDKYDDKPVTRSEFQLRRDFFKSMNIDSLYDLENKLDAVWQYLTNEWLRLVDGPFDRGNRNHSRVAMHPFWIALSSIHWGTYTKQLRHTKRVTLGPIKTFVDMMAGCAMSMAAAADLAINNVHDIAVNASTIMRQRIYEIYETNRKEFTEKMITKRRRFLTQLPEKFTTIYFPPNSLNFI